MSGVLRAAWLIARKDLRVEARNREIAYTTLFFAMACVLVFAFAFVVEEQPLVDAAAGILWVAVTFSGTLALGRAFERERQSETLRALLLAPVERAAVYLGKFLALLLLCLPLETLASSLRIWLLCRVLQPGIAFWTCVKAEWANVAVSLLTPSQSGGGPGQIYMLSRGGARSMVRAWQSRSPTSPARLSG